MADLQKPNCATGEEAGIETEDTSSGPATASITEPFNPNDIKINTPPFSVAFLIDRLENDEIDRNTEFQRSGDLWTEGQQSRLIESLLLGLPLPAFYFDTSCSRWGIIDGLQRCCSLYNFCVQKTLKLTGLDYLKELEGKGFDDLDRLLRRSILTRPVTVNLLEKGTPRQVRYILFKRLNTGGLELKPQEIRHAIFQGKIATFIRRLARLDSFLRVTGGRIPVERMQDFDFVSRFLAFYLVPYAGYQPDLDSFLIRSLERLDGLSDDALDRIEQDFRNGLQLAGSVFGKDAFRKRDDPDAPRNPINKAYFEVIAVTFARLDIFRRQRLLECASLFRNNLIRLMRIPRYAASLSGGTGARENVLYRFSGFETVVELSLHGKELEGCG